MAAELTFYIDGELIPGRGEKKPVINPADGRIAALMPVAGEDELELALSAARRAGPPWARTSPAERGQVLRRAADLLRRDLDKIARIITTEEGKTLAEARGEAANGAAHLDWMAEEGRRAYGRIIPARSPGQVFQVVKEPIGLVLALAPWNFPLTQGLKKVAAALAAGCPVILKGPSLAPGASLALAEILHEAGLPKGALAVLFGEPKSLAARLIGDPRVRKVSFTGSVEAGREIAALSGRHLKPAVLELGGHAPALVFGDADAAKAARALARSKARNAGQVCVSPSRFLVHESVFDEFAEAFAAELASLVVGPGLDPKTDVGPLASLEGLEAALRLIENAVGLGAALVAGGERPSEGDLAKGFFLRPALLTGVDQRADIMRLEPFCPVAPLAPFNDPEEAISKANSVPYGLAAYVFTASLQLAHLAATRLSVGMVAVNQASLAQPETPFGGVGDSGWGREGASEGLEACLVGKFINQAAQF
jgi:succinate-semialdehyde dehydrogenase/glutarate-semialdehyde dehydrogenase